MSDLSESVRAKVLIAESDAIVALDLQGMVMRLGYDVVAIVDSGQAAVAAVKRFQPDIVLLDMVLNGALDGIDVAREIHKILDLPIIFCLSTADLAFLTRAKEISYSGYLLKPINPDSLATTLDTSLYKYKLEKRVQKAEQNLLSLAKKCKTLEYFFDNDAAYEWVWKPELGSCVVGADAAEGLPVSALEERIDGVMLTAFAAPAVPVSDGESDGDRVSALLEVSSPERPEVRYALIGIRDRESGSVSGLVIPLAGDGRL